MSLTKSTIDILSQFKSEDQPEPKPDWYEFAPEKTKNFYDFALIEYKRIVSELGDIETSDDARKIKNLTISTDNTKAYFNSSGLVKTANEDYDIEVTRSIVNKSNSPDMVKQIHNWNSSIQAHYKPGGKHKVSRSALEKARLKAEKLLKEFDIKLARELNQSLQDNVVLKASSEVKIQNKNLITENSKNIVRIQQLEVANASYERQLVQASTLHQEIKQLQREVAKLTAENALLKSAKGGK